MWPDMCSKVVTENAKWLFNVLHFVVEMEQGQLSKFKILFTCPQMLKYFNVNHKL